ncbi:hypothetical protein SSCG_02576 [Streptomyces clavuligerus]|nr:hypothetical protein SSCG_02576 [Streptomyces clavuligerus]
MIRSRRRRRCIALLYAVVYLGSVVLLLTGVLRPSIYGAVPHLV